MKYFKDSKNEVYALEDQDAYTQDERGNDIPTRFLKTDWVEITEQEVNVLLKPVVTTLQLTEAAQLVVQELLDDKAKERNYSNILSLCTYETSKIQKFKAEGQAGVKWRDEAWAALYKLQVDIAADTVAAPKTIEESTALALSVLPVMQWPDEGISHD